MSEKIELIDTHAHAHLLRTYHGTDENGVEIINDERRRFLNDFMSQSGPEIVTKVIQIPINFPQNMDWHDNDLRSVFCSKRKDGEGVFRDRLLDENGKSIPGFYMAQGLHPKFVHQILYKDFIYINDAAVRKTPSGMEDLVDKKELKERERFVQSGIEEQIKNHKDVVAIGETGFEFYYDFEKRVCDHPAYQEKWFRWHIRLAKKYDLPLIIHLRSGARREQNANKKAIDILKDMKAKGILREKNPGVIHCFIGNKTEAREFHRIGFVLGIGASFTYGDPENCEVLKSSGGNVRPEFQVKHYRKLYEVVRDIPLEWIVLETDAPYLPLKDNSGYRENTSLAIPQIAKKIVEAKNKAAAEKGVSEITLKDVAEITTENALRVFPGIR